MRKWLSNLSRRRGQRGQGLVEYASLLVLVAATAVGSLSALGGGIGTVYQTIICSLGEGGEECGCEYETITHGPSYTCVGGVFAAEAYTSCGTDTSLSMLVENLDGSTEEIALSYDADNEMFSTVHTDTTDICSRLNDSPPAKLYLVSRQNDGETVNTWRINSSLPTGPGDDDDTGGGDPGGGDPGGGDPGGGDPGGGDPGGGDPGGGDPGGGDPGGGDPGGGDPGGGNPGAILGASPASLVFGDIAQGASSNQTITLTHIGSAGAPALTVSSMTLSGTNAGDFSVLFTAPATINPGESRSFNVIFTPAATGAHSASLTITHDGELSPLTIALSGSGISSVNSIAFIVGDTNLDSNDTIIMGKLQDFGHTVQVFRANASYNTVMDTNPNAIVISESINSGDVGSRFRNAPVPVMIHEAYLLDDMNMSNWYGWVDDDDVSIVDSSHPAAGGFSGSNVDITDSNSQLTAGQPPNSAHVVATYRNGNSDKAAIFVFDAGASLTSGTAAARRASFPMGDNMAPNVNNTGWAMYDATLTWLLEGGSGSGGGGGPTANATIGVSPTSVDYGTVVQGSSADWNITITNTGPSGAAPLTISSLSVSGANVGDFTTSATTPITINQGQSATVTMTFTPGAVGARSASLAIAHNGANTSPVVVSLVGEGTTPPPATLGLSTAALNFGDVIQGEDGTRTVRLTHTGATGALPIMISSMTFSGSHSGDFSVSPSAPFTLNQGQSRDVTVTFTPAATGSRSGTLSIAHDGTNTSPMTVSLSGQGIQGAPRIVLIVGNANNLSSNNDHLLVAVLQNGGYTVTPIDDGSSGSVNTNNYELIVISASVDANTVDDTFRNTNKPVVVMERAILEEMNMATSSGSYESSNSVDIVDSSHPIMAGRSSSIGNNVQLGRVTAAAGATRLARHPGQGGNNNDDVIFVFSSGFPARRVAFSIRETTYPNVNANGSAMFMAAISWALG